MVSVIWEGGGGGGCSAPFIIMSTRSRVQIRIWITIYPHGKVRDGNLWLVKFDGFILQPMAKPNHKFSITQPGLEYEIRSSPEFAVPTSIKAMTLEFESGSGSGSEFSC